MGKKHPVYGKGDNIRGYQKYCEEICNYGIIKKIYNEVKRNG